MRLDKPQKWLLPVLICLFSGLTQADHDKVPRVSFVIDEKSGNYQPILKGFREYTRKYAGKLIRTDLINTESLTVAELQKRINDHYNLVIPLGIEATRASLNASKNLPTFSLMVNQSELRALFKSERRKGRIMSGIFRDQPFSRFGELIRFSLPHLQKVGVLLGSNSKTLKPTFDKEMGRQKLIPRVTILRNNDLPQRVIERLALKSEVIISVYDEAIYSQENIKNHLLTTFRYQIPVIGVTKRYTDLGAFASIYTDRYELGKQTGKQVLKLLDMTDNTLEPVYPETFEISTNPFVMRNFGVKDLDEAMIKKHILTNEKNAQQP